MKKVLGLLGILLLGFVLAGCTDKDPEVTAPTLISFKIDQEEPLEGSELTRFYRGKNEMVEVEILINNPSNLPITSIVINGTNHRISKFKEESTTRKIIFDLDVGDKTGALVYSLDEIKYTNGDKTEKTLLSGSEFKIYVYKDLPSIERTDYSVGQNYIYVEFDQIDVDGVIESGTLTAQLYSGENSVETIVIGPNDVSVRFDNLLASNSYDLRFVADYDLDNNKGIKEHEVLLPLQFSTTAVTIPFAHITNIDVFSNSVTFDADFEDVDGVIVENGLNVHIFDGETSIMQQPLTESPVSITFDDEELIKNNHTYTIKIIGTYNLRDGIGDLEDNVLAIGTFTTPSKSVPSPEILELNIEENRVNFDVDIDDPLMLIVEGSLNAHIYVNGELIDSSPVINNHVDFQIFNLFANELFEIRITASYDLNDGSPLHVDEIIFTEEYTTRINEPPTVTVTEVIVKQGYITLDLSVSDLFETLKGDIVAVLKEDGVAVGSPISFGTDAAVIEFEYLVNYLKVYTIEIIADYNLRDGIGTLNDQMLYSNIIVSVEKKEPVAEIKNLVETNNSLTFNVRVMDADDTILPNTVLVYLYKDGEIDPDHSPIPVGFDSPLVTFTDLLSNYEYSIIVKAIYDLDDGTLPIDLKPQNIYSGLATTLEKSLPTAVVEDFVSDTDSLNLDITINDTDGVIVPNSVFVYLYLDGVKLDLYDTQLIIGANSNVLFENLLSNNAYTVKVFAAYDLNDGNSVISEFELAQGTTFTEAKSEPGAVISIVDETKNSVTIDVEVLDPDSVISGQAVVEISIGDDPAIQTFLLNPGVNSTIVLDGVTGIQSNTRFIIKVYADYNLDDGNPDIIRELLSYSNTSTLVNDLPTAEFLGSVLGKDTFTFDVNVIDDDDVILPGTLFAVLYKDGVEDLTIAPLPLNVGLNSGMIFNGLKADSVYVVIVKTDYYLKDGGNTFTNYQLSTFASLTKKLDLPSTVITLKEAKNTELVFDINVTDNDLTITSYLYAELFKDGVYTGTSALLNPGLNPDISFDGLEFGSIYTVKVVAVYNLNDGKPDSEHEVLGYMDASTIDLIEIYDFAEVVKNQTVDLIGDVSQVFVNFDIGLIDTFGVVTSSELYVTLYNQAGLPIGNTEMLLSEFSVEFINLQFNKAYYFTVSANVDLGAGSSIIEVYRQDFVTQPNIVPVVDVSEIIIRQGYINVNFNVIDPNGTLRGELTAILYENGTPVSTTEVFDINDTEVEFAYLATFDKDYTVEITADYNLGDGNGKLIDQILFTRVLVGAERKEPVMEITNLVIENDLISFDVELLDADATVVANSVMVYLYKGAALIESFTYTTGIESYLFNTNLISGTEYTVIVEANYDLVDGSGIQTSMTIADELYTTISTIFPSNTFANGVSDQDTVTLDIDFTDTDATILLGSIVAYAYQEGLQVGAGVPLINGTNPATLFPGLQSDTITTIKVFIDYNLNDNTGNHLTHLLSEYVINTEAKTAPSGEIVITDSTKTTVRADITITDDDSVITGQATAQLYIDGVAYLTPFNLNPGLNDIEFTGIQSDTNYTLRVITDYNLDDGEPEHTGILLNSSGASSLAKVSPFATIVTTSIEKEQLVFSITLTDADIVLLSQATASLYLDNVLYGSSQLLNAGVNTVSFPGIQSNTTYTLKVEADYNLDDGNADITGEVLNNVITSTLINVEPTALITLNEARNTELLFDIELTDDDVLVINTPQAVLFKNGVATGDTVDLVTGTNSPVTFSDLEFGQEYTVKVVVDYNYKDGNSDVLGMILDTFTESTINLIALDNFEEAKRNLDDTPVYDPAQVFINFELVLDDQFSILVDSYVTLTLYNSLDVQVGDSQVLYDDVSMELVNLLFGNDYYFIITANVDTGNGAGVQDVYRYDFATTPLPELEIIITDLIVTNTSISMEINNILDPDSIVNSNFEVVLFTDGVETHSQVLTIGLVPNVISFATDGTDGSDYQIIVRSTADFLDGVGPIVEHVHYTRVVIYSN